MAAKRFTAGFQCSFLPSRMKDRYTTQKLNGSPSQTNNRSAVSRTCPCGHWCCSYVEDGWSRLLLLWRKGAASSQSSIESYRVDIHAMLLASRWHRGASGLRAKEIQVNVRAPQVNLCECAMVNTYRVWSSTPECESKQNRSNGLTLLKMDCHPQSCAIYHNYRFFTKVFDHCPSDPISTLHLLNAVQHRHRSFPGCGSATGTDAHRGRWGWLGRSEPAGTKARRCKKCGTLHSEETIL